MSRAADEKLRKTMLATGFTQALIFCSVRLRLRPGVRENQTEWHLQTLVEVFLLQRLRPEVEQNVLGALFPRPAYEVLILGSKTKMVQQSAWAGHLRAEGATQSTASTSTQ